MRPPCRKDCVRLKAAQAWAAIARETILRSFKTAAITVAVDGSKDCLISCLAHNQDLANEVQQQLCGDNSSRAGSLVSEDTQVETEEQLIPSENSDSNFEGLGADDLLFSVQMSHMSVL